VIQVPAERGTAVSEETYRGYKTIITQQGAGYVGVAYCDNSAHSPLTTVHPRSNPEMAIAELKSDIDYWLAPDWTRNLEAAQTRIKELEDALRLINESAADDIQYGRAEGTNLYSIEAISREALKE
jgi:hypothetical protein